MADRVQAQFGRRVAALRHERKWSQEELAHRARIGPQFLSDVERGKANPSLKTINGIAAAFGMPVAHVIAEPTSIPAETAALMERHSRAEQVHALAIVRALFESLDESER